MESVKYHLTMCFLVTMSVIMIYCKGIMSTDSDGEIKKTASEGFAALVERLTKPK